MLKYSLPFFFLKALVLLEWLCIQKDIDYFIESIQHGDIESGVSLALLVCSNLTRLSS